MGTSTVWVRGRGSENTVFTPEMAGKRTFIPSSGSIMLHSYIFCWIMLYSCSTNPHRWLSYMYRMMLDVAQIWPLEEPRTPCALKLRCQPAVPVAQPWGQLVATSPFVVCYVQLEEMNLSSSHHLGASQKLFKIQLLVDWIWFHEGKWPGAVGAVSPFFCQVKAGTGWIRMDQDGPWAKGQIKCLTPSYAQQKTRQRHCTWNELVWLSIQEHIFRFKNKLQFDTKPKENWVTKTVT